MGTGISRAGLGLALLAVGLAGCGGAAKTSFGWLHPRLPPASWTAVAIPSGATLAYPRSWRRQRSDPGTATAVLLGAGGRYLGYVNLTPRQGAETFANWASFRIDHNAEEGDHDIKRLASASGLSFLGGRGSCVSDAYTTKTGARFVEIACLVGGSREDAVIVAAAPPGVCRNESATLQRVIEGVRT